MTKDTLLATEGRALPSDRAVAPSASSPQAVSPVPASIPSAIPTMDERNEFYTAPHFDMRGGRLGVTPILWEMRMAYRWDRQLAEEYPEWDQCCTCWVFALSERQARAEVWTRFATSCVIPEVVASCAAKRFRNERDDEIDQRLASAIEARSGETREAGLDPKDESAVPTGRRPTSVSIKDPL